MLTANRLEKIMELESELREEYQGQLDKKTAEIEALTAKQEKLQATVDKQLETISTLSTQATENQRVEQLNRELGNRADKLQSELEALKKRLKTLQKEMAEVREENNALTRFDPARMKKNLDSNKKKLAEKTKAADLLQKNLNESKRENAELQRKVEELEAKLPDESDAENDGETEEASAA